MATTATYLELAEGIARTMEGGPPGTRIPSENEICSAHHVSRPTARAALQELERRFLVRRVRGAGTFVSRRVDYVVSPDRPPSATIALRAAGVEPQITVISARTVRAPADVAEHLGLSDDLRVVAIHRSIAIDGVVASVGTAYVVAGLVDGLAPRMRHGTSLFAVLRDVYGIEPRRRWSRASLEVPSTAVALELELEGRPPSWRLEGVSESRADRSVAVEFTRTWMRSDITNLVFEMGRG